MCSDSNLIELNRDGLILKNAKFDDAFDAGSDQKCTTRIGSSGRVVRVQQAPDQMVRICRFLPNGKIDRSIFPDGPIEVGPVFFPLHIESEDDKIAIIGYMTGMFVD